MEPSFLADGRVCLVLTASSELAELVALVNRTDRAAAYSGRMPSPAAGAFVRAGRHVLAIAELVPQPVPNNAEGHPQQSRWITTSQAAQTLGVSERAIRKRIARGSLVARMIGGRWLIDIKEIPNAAA